MWLVILALRQALIYPLGGNLTMAPISEWLNCRPGVHVTIITESQFIKTVVFPDEKIRDFEDLQCALFVF